MNRRSVVAFARMLAAAGRANALDQLAGLSTRPV